MAVIGGLSLVCFNQNMVSWTRVRPEAAIALAARRPATTSSSYTRPCNRGEAHFRSMGEHIQNKPHICHAFYTLRMASVLHNTVL